MLCFNPTNINYNMCGWFLCRNCATGWFWCITGLRAVAMWSSSSFANIAWHRYIPHPHPSGYGGSSHLRCKARGTVKVILLDSWRYSRNYGFYAFCQRRNVPHGLQFLRLQNNAGYEISMSYGNIHDDNPMCNESPRHSRYPCELRIRLATPCRQWTKFWEI